LVLFLIILFSFLIIYQFRFSYHENFTNNNLQYKDYPPNALILSQQNAGNIEYLKNEMDDLKNLNQTVVDLSNNYVDLFNQVQQLTQQQADYASQMTGGDNEPMEISGTNLSDTDNTDDANISSTTNMNDDTNNTNATDDEEDNNNINGINTSSSISTSTVI
jgi:hypothetical protein